MEENSWTNDAWSRSIEDLEEQKARAQEDAQYRRLQAEAAGLPAPEPFRVGNDADDLPF